MTPGVRGGWSRTKRVLVAVAGLVLIGAVGAAVLGWVSPDGGGKDPVATNLPAATDTVTRQTLVDRQSEDGLLGYGDSTSVPSGLQGTVTKLPAADSVIRRGQEVWRLDDKPVVLLYGSLPAYRTLAYESEGADVEQLEKNLCALGYRGFTVDEEFTANTRTAVKEWQEDLGLKESGTVEPRRGVVAPGAVRVTA